jgi:outer membrane lipoprotein carrier protein
MCVLVAGASRAGQPTLEEVLAQHCRARETVMTLKAQFDQIKEFTLFDEEEKSKGVLYFSHPHRICWQYSEPDESATVINGSDGWSVFPHIKQIQKFKLQGSQTNKVLSIVGFGPCAAPLTESFDIALEEVKKNTVTLDMTPTDDGIRPYFSRIHLTLGRSDFLPRRIDLYEKSGDILRFEFSKIKRDIELDNAIFEYVVPGGYEVVEY